LKTVRGKIREKMMYSINLRLYVQMMQEIRNRFLKLMKYIGHCKVCNICHSAKFWRNIQDSPALNCNQNINDRDKINFDAEMFCNQEPGHACKLHAKPQVVVNLQMKCT
jgi:hypothetical protein